MDKTLLAVNGTLMRGLELNPNMLAVGATFVARGSRPTRATGSGRSAIAIRRCCARRVKAGSVALELWAVPSAGLATILQNEPPGLSIGKVVLADGSIVLGVLGEPFLCQGQREITEFGGWRAYIATKSSTAGA